MSLNLAFYKGTRAENPKARLFDRLVCAWRRSRGRFSHTELAFDRIGPAWLCWSSSFRDKGVRPTHINLGSGRWVLVVLPAYDPTPALQWFETHRGRTYDVPGILGYVVWFIKQVRGWLYCSESCAKAIRASAAASSPDLPLEWPPSDISPSALFAWAAGQPGARVFELPSLQE